MVTLDSLTFDLTGCSLQERSESHYGWMNADHVAHMLRFHHGPLDWPFDLTDPEAAAAFYGRQCADNGGVMLSLGPVTAAGAEALTGLFKYRAPAPHNLAMYYAGIVWIPFQECRFQVNVEAMEHGTTGVREATVMLIEKDRWPKPAEDTPPVVLKSAEELFERLGSSQIRQLPSDDPRYDSHFPSHPLSQVRTRLAEVIATMRLDTGGQPLTPYRVRRGGAAS